MADVRAIHHLDQMEADPGRIGDWLRWASKRLRVLAALDFGALLRPDIGTCVTRVITEPA